MPSTYTTNLRTEQQADGENSTTWGSKANVVFTLLEQAITGVASVAMTDAEYTLSATNGVSDEARNMVVTMTGTLTGAQNVIVPSVDKIYAIKNSTTGGFAITVKTSAGTGISVANGETEMLYCDATNVLRLQTTPTGTGAPVRADSPTLVTPALGTPSALNLANATDLPAAGVTGTALTLAGGNMTGVLGLTAGTALLPAIIPSGDPNTGVWFPAADTVAVSTGGSERMRIDSGGKVGIGLGASYSLPLSVVGDGNGQNIQLNGRTGDSLVQMFFRTFGGGNNLASISSESNGTLYFGTGSQTAPTVPTERMRIDSSGNVLVTNPAGLGYGTGAGGTVTQATSKATAVTLNKPTGWITAAADALAANTTARFTFTNSLISVTDCIVLTIRDGVTAGAYQVWVDGTANGSCTVAIRNITAGSLSNAVIISFAIIKGATS
jgi:hypothetical protein